MLVSWVSCGVKGGVISDEPQVESNRFCIVFGSLVESDKFELDFEIFNGGMCGFIDSISCWFRN